MKNWDLHSGTEKLGLAMDTLQTAAAEVEKYWSDEANRKFRETYLEPLDPKVRAFLSTVQHLSELLASAERDCGIN